MVPFANQEFKVLFVCIQYALRVEAGDWRGEDDIGFIVVHHEETDVTTEGHEREVPCAIILHDAGIFVGKGTETKHIGDGLVVDVKMNAGSGSLKSLLSIGMRPGMASAWMPGIDGGRGSADGGLGRPVGFWVVLRSPLRGRFMWPLDVAELGMKYFVTDLMSRCGAPRRKPALIAMMSDDFGRLPRLWCMNVTALALVV